MIKEARPKTRSTSVASRDFCFLYPILMFNAWVMANTMISRGDGMRTDSRITLIDMKIRLMIIILIQTELVADLLPNAL